jgi:hypothetical protein
MDDKDPGLQFILLGIIPLHAPTDSHENKWKIYQTGSVH